MSENKMPGLLEAKRVFASATGVVIASGHGDSFSNSFRIVQIRREEGDYYGKSLEDGRWYPIRSIEVHRCC
jgi:hypothetical protein